ncbi:MAG: Zn-ribbon domain-containing OB-fold protein [Proteobacteria bacterium]|nr:Zn-ribbon domain-containing OB-fold protein [Pseudomonadota bacterium]
MTISESRVEQEYFYSEIMMDMTWNVEPGAVMNRFFERLQQERRLYGVKCPKCRRVYLPPRLVCGDCWADMNEWVPLENKGRVMAKTACYYTLLNNETGERRQTPFVLALIQLDGADTTFNHFVETDDPELVEIGKEVEIVFQDKLNGDMSDIRYFKLTSG